MSVLEVPVEVERRLAEAIKGNVEGAIERMGLEDAATRLGMHPVGLRSFMQSSRWNLSVALRVATSLGLPDGQRLEEALRTRA